MFVRRVVLNVLGTLNSQDLVSDSVNQKIITHYKHTENT